MTDAATKLKKVTNCWTIYTSDRPDEQLNLAEIGRPQDWGNAKKWMYRVYVLEAQGYRNEVHCWIDERVSEAEHLEAFASLICTITLPGWNPKLSGRDYMDEDDFWEKEWGEMPPFYEPGDEMPGSEW